MVTSFTFKVLFFYSCILMLLISSVVAFIHRCRLSAKKGEMFFYIEFKETYDEKGRLDLVPIDSNVEGTEGYSESMKLMASVSACFSFLPFYHDISRLVRKCRLPTPTFIPFSLMLITGLWIAPIISLLILEVNENDVLKIFVLTILGSFVSVSTGISLSGSIYMDILGLLLPPLFLPLLIYHLQSLIFWGIAIGTPWNVKQWSEKSWPAME